MPSPQEGCEMVDEILSSLSMYPVAKLGASGLALSSVEFEERDAKRIESK